MSHYQIPPPVCPSCRQSYVQAVRVLPLSGLPAWICDECDAFWLESPDENPSAYIQFPDFMLNHISPGGGAIWSIWQIRATNDQQRLCSQQHRSEACSRSHPQGR